MGSRHPEEEGAHVCSCSLSMRSSLHCCLHPSQPPQQRQPQSLCSEWASLAAAYLEHHLRTGCTHCSRTIMVNACSQCRRSVLGNEHSLHESHVCSLLLLCVLLCPFL